MKQIRHSDCGEVLLRQRGCPHEHRVDEEEERSGVAAEEHRGFLSKDMRENHLFIRSVGQ